MLPAFLMGVAALFVVWTFLGWYARAKTEDVKRTLRWTGITVGILVIAILILTGRFAAAMAGLMGLSAWAWRVFNMIQVGRQFGGMFRGMSGASRSHAGGPKKSTVESKFIRMTLDHDSGDMDGDVLTGPYANRRLSSLSQKEILDLRDACESDPDSLALVESYLDRAHPDWRADPGGNDGAHQSGPPSSAMTPDEARRILGLADGASDDDINAAYRRLMGQLHPDKGGSDYLAAKVNAAKDLLLKK
ncbi:MAG: DnaJ domain-containing protein [Rhodobacteraceae bacterium]|nr:DnaJ domain-containing protein [Paracoccaceae bacterium]